MADADRLQMLAEVCVKAAHDAQDTEVAAMLLDSAQRFLERANPQLAPPKTDVREFNRQQFYAEFRH